MEDSKPPSLRCPHCAGPLSKELETSRWTIAPFIRDSFSMIGSAVGGTASAFYGFNHVMPIVQRRIKGPMWVHFLVGETLLHSAIFYTPKVYSVATSGVLSAPPVMVFSSACAGLAGGAVPALAQLVSSSYHAAVSSSSLPRVSEDEKMHKTRSSSPL